MDLSQISRTAILTLICHAVEAKNPKSGFHDPMAVLCLERLIANTSGEDQRWIIKKKQAYEGLHARDARALTRRVLAFDQATNRFIAGHPKCTVINLACGFDTRFWRIENEKCTYLELDLPGVIQLKKEILKDHLRYEMLAGSVLDTAWIDQVTAHGNTDFLLLAEGLWMWFPQAEAVRLFKEIGEKFERSQLVLDVVHERYTQGIWKQLVRLHSKIDWGLDVAWVSGIKNAQEIEAYGKGLKVISEEKGSTGPVISVSIHAN
jgi:O-methyltransferase involved in polyketide biosynthesis